MTRTLALSIALAAAAASADGDCDKLDATSPQSSAAWQRESLIRSIVCGDELPKAGEAGPDAAAWMDRQGADTSEIARAMFVWQCAPNLKDDAPGYLLDKGISAFAACSVDARKLDKAAFEAELKKLAVSEKLTAQALERFDTVKADADRWLKRIDAAVKQDPVYKKILLDAPDAAWAAWQKTYSAHEKDFALAYAVEDKALAVPFGDRKTPQDIGCEPLRSAFRAYVTGHHPKSRDDVKAAATDEVGGPLLERLALCDALEGRSVDAGAEVLVLQSGRYRQGPRVAAGWAAFDAAQDVKQFKGEYRVGPADMKLVTKDELLRVAGMVFGDKVRKLSSFYDASGNDGAPRGSQGVMEQATVAAAKKTADGVVLTFKTEKWEVPDFACTNTGRIGNFAPDGTPSYIFHCKESGSHIESYTLTPRSVTARSGEAVKQGQIVKLLTGDMFQDGAPAPAFVVEVDEPHGKRPKPVSYLGVPLK